MTCKQLGGACDMKFKAETFEEMAAMSKQHGTEMFEKQDKPHLEAMGAMQKLMEAPTAMMEWFANKKKEFDSLPETN